MRMRRTPVYIITGFLDSGKTTLVKETLMMQEWIEPGLTLLVTCEEGEEEYSDVYLKTHDMVHVEVEDESELNSRFFEDLEKQYHPVQVVIEYNGMWKLEDLITIKYPRIWECQGIYSTVNGTTLDMYLMNMRNVMMEQLTDSELIIINRCPEGLNRSGFRRAVKVQNPMAQLIFEDMEGQIIPQSEEDLPYDIKADVIEIEDDDFGIFYVDAYENPAHYIGKTVSFKALSHKPRGLRGQVFLPLRKIMTCCADDVRFYGYPCKYPATVQVPLKQWIKLTAEFKFEDSSLYQEGGEQPVLYLKQIEKCAPPKNDIAYLG